MTGSKKAGDYCWSVYSGKATADPVHIGGAQHKPADPSPEDSGEFKRPETAKED